MKGGNFLSNNGVNTMKHRGFKTTVIILLILMTIFSCFTARHTAAQTYEDQVNLCINSLRVRSGDLQKYYQNVFESVRVSMVGLLKQRQDQKYRDHHGDEEIYLTIYKRCNSIHDRIDRGVHFENYGYTKE